MGTYIIYKTNRHNATRMTILELLYKNPFSQMSTYTKGIYMIYDEWTLTIPYMYTLYIPPIHSCLLITYSIRYILYFQTIGTTISYIYVSIYHLLLHSTSFNSKIPQRAYSLLYVCHHRRYVKRQINSVTWAWKFVWMWIHIRLYIFIRKFK